MPWNPFAHHDEHEYLPKGPLSCEEFQKGHSKDLFLALSRKSSGGRAGAYNNVLVLKLVQMAWWLEREWVHLMYFTGKRYCLRLLFSRGVPKIIV